MQNITVTESAAKHFKKVTHDEKNCVRLALKGGGCSGFMYSFNLHAEELIEDDDIVIDLGDNVKFVVDPLSMMYLTEAKVDYIEDFTGSRIAVENPNVQNTCGCGESVTF